MCVDHILMNTCYVNSIKDIHCESIMNKNTDQFSDHYPLYCHIHL